MSDIPSAPYSADTRARGWRFEVDTEKVKASETWLRAKRGDVKGALLLLWSEAWQQTPCGSLADDDELIALLIDMPAPAFAKHRAVLMRGWWKADDGRLYHDTITERVLAMLAKRAKDAKRAADRRGRADDHPPTPPEVADVSRVTHTGVGPEFDTKHQAPSTTEAKASGDAKPRATRKCPKSFHPEDADAWTAEHCPGVDWRRETERMRDHTFKNSITDWLGTWRNWMRRSFDGSNPGATETNYQRSMRERVEQVAPSIAAKRPGTVVSINPMETLDGLTRIAAR